MELIDKDAVITEIERLQDSIKATAIDDRIRIEHAEAYAVCVKLRSFIGETAGKATKLLNKYRG